MSMLGTLLVLLIVSFAIIIVIFAVIRERVEQHKRENLHRKRETAQRYSATVVSAKRKVDWGDWLTYNSRLGLNKLPEPADPNSPDLDFYLIVEWTNPETQLLVTSPTRTIHGPCPYAPGDEVFIYVHPDMKEVWLDNPRPLPGNRSAHGFLS